MISSPGSSTVSIRMIAGQSMEFGQRQNAHPFNALHMDPGIERGQRHAHVGGMRGNAERRRAEDGVHAIESLGRVAALTRISFVAARPLVIIKIGTSRALQDVAAHRCHVAYLRRCAGQDRTRQDRIAHARCGSRLSPCCEQQPR